jgi:RES domain-containing protein
MPVAWRIVKAKYANDAFSGAGAQKAGGRWNSKGIPSIYCSEHLSLAALETLIHTIPIKDLQFVSFKLEWKNLAVTEILPEQLAKNWRTEPPGSLTMAAGDNWARSRQSAILKVPSVLIPEESNFVLNPLHRDFEWISIGEPTPFRFDQRLHAVVRASV